MSNDEEKKKRFVDFCVWAKEKNHSFFFHLFLPGYSFDDQQESKLLFTFLHVSIEKEKKTQNTKQRLNGIAPKKKERKKETETNHRSEKRQIRSHEFVLFEYFAHSFPVWSIFQKSVNDQHALRSGPRFRNH